MPKAFDDCRKKGGRIRTITLSGNKYLHVCYIGGKVYRGEVKKKKTQK